MRAVRWVLSVTPRLETEHDNVTAFPQEDVKQADNVTRPCASQTDSRWVGCDFLKAAAGTDRSRRSGAASGQSALNFRSQRAAHRCPRRQIEPVQKPAARGRLTEQSVGRLTDAIELLDNF